MRFLIHPAGLSNSFKKQNHDEIAARFHVQN